MIEGIDYELYNYMKLTISMKEHWKMLSLYERERYDRLRGKKEMGTVWELETEDKVDRVIQSKGG